MPIPYEDLKPIYKMREKSPSLYSYMLRHNIYHPLRLFHEKTKEELIEDYKNLTAEHLKLLENL